MSETLARFNPSWVMAVATIVGQILFLGTVYQRGNDTAQQVVALSARMDKTDEWRAEYKRQMDVNAMAVEKELKFMNTNLDALRRSLESRGIPVQPAAPTP